jgi:hypothetical protein
MPKRKLFNLKNLGSWAGIKKKRKRNGDGDLEAEEKCMFSFVQRY